MYEYRCTIKRIIDGDTLVVDVDLGFTAHVEVHFRLIGIDAPELTTPEGAVSRDALQSRLPIGSTAIVRSMKPLRTDKFGRWLGRFFTGDCDVNQDMVEAGFARMWA